MKLSHIDTWHDGQNKAQENKTEESLNHFKNITTYDVIPMEDHLLMIGDKTLYQYNYSSEGLTLLSQFLLK